MTQDNFKPENNQQDDIAKANTNADAEKPVAQNEADSIMKVGIKTFYYCIVFLAFFITLFYTVFPYRALVMYTDLNLQENAYHAAKKHVKIHEDDYKSTQPSYDSKFADSLLACVNNSISLMNSYKAKQGVNGAKTQYYANEVVLSVDKYNSYKSMATRTDEIDAYNKQNSPKSLQVYVYNFSTDILRSRAKALAYTGNIATVFHEVLLATNSMTAIEHEPDSRTIEEFIKTFYIIADVIEGQLSAVDYFSIETSESGLPLLENVTNARLNINGDSFRFLYNKTAYIPHAEYEDASKYYGGTPIFTRITKHIDAYKAYIMGMDESNRDQMLKKVYYTKAVTDLTMNFYRFMHLTFKANNSIFDESKITNNDHVFIMNDETFSLWSNTLMFDIEGGGKRNPLEFFSLMLSKYIAMYIVN